MSPKQCHLEETFTRSVAIHLAMTAVHFNNSMAQYTCRKIHRKTAKSTVMQLHTKTQVQIKTDSMREEQTRHTPDGYVGMPNVHNGSHLQFYKWQSWCAKEKTRTKI